MSTGLGFVTMPDRRDLTATTPLLNDKISVPGDATYKDEQGRYWSNQQRDVHPQCRLTPTSPEDISTAVIVLRLTNCPFAVKSGGHAAFVGASNVQDGITIDLKLLKDLSYDGDSTTHIAAGNTWGDVYSYLDPQGVAVVGGRVSAIGVGGLTLGGGISFFSGHRGWACDGVGNYQVVLANGEIVNANTKSRPDLYYALRGGGKNFGIVTRFDLMTFKQGKLWGGSKLYPAAANATLFKAFEKFNNDAPQDPHAALVLSAGYLDGSYAFSNSYEQDQGIPDPPIFDEFKAVQEIPGSSSVKIATLTELVTEFNNSNPGGFRESYATVTFKNSAWLQSEIFKIFMEEIDPDKDSIEGYLPAVVFQPVTKAQASYFSINGGNALGISVEDCPLNLVSLAFRWSSIKDDSKVYSAIDNIIRRSQAVARPRGLNFRYLYQNYASRNQNVFAGYGPQNQRRLQSISHKYDPGQIFQRLVSGYFNLSSTLTS
ncbi:MAG: hypothetical protein M4579_000654 [Chaenotheca gracillima]|nr:MAG: hypothetical protein M4579_000654 [Chaenotheca gracillima]